MDSVVYWYKKEVYFWRSAGSLFWSVVFLLFLTVVCVFAWHFSFLHPWQSISGFFMDLASLVFPVVFLVLTAVQMAVAYSVSYSVIASVPHTRLQNYVSLFGRSRLSHGLVCVVGGACVARCCAVFMDQDFCALTSQHLTPEWETVVLNEPHLFLVLSGAATGFIYYCNFHLHQWNYLSFPMLQRDKYFRVRSEMVEHAWQCVWLAWTAVRGFYVCYFIAGGCIRGWIVEALKLDNKPASLHMDTVLGILNLNVFWQTFLCSFFICYSWKMTSVLYRIYHTQHLEVPVLPAFTFPSKHCLSEALASDDPLLQHLAFLDLSHLSRTSPVRRQEIFSLSQPGGHPHTWRAVASTCLQQVEALVTKVHNANAAWLANVPLQQHTEKIFHTSVADEELLARGIHPPSQTSSLLSKMHAFLKDKPILSYFFMELPDARSRQLFAGCQTQIWAIEALSHLAAASFREDKYGVVQQSLPPIFTSLVSLHDNIEKYFKLQPPALRRYGRETLAAPHLLLCQQLRETLKTAIYRLTNTFATYVGDLQLGAGCLKRLRPFLDYKE